jgi:endonuclease/exonuclease/phosphatase family metal-dependent hydrolase
MSLKLLSLNIEAHRHLDRVVSLLDDEQPEVICFQEVFEVDIPRILKAFQQYRRPGATPLSWHYSPMARVTRTSEHIADALGPWGILQATVLPVQGRFHHFYVKKGGATELPIFFENNDSNSMDRVVLLMEVMKKSKLYRVATTHFTWSPQGSLTKLQLQNYQVLEQYLDQYPELILCGDFNSPRQGEPNNIFNQLARRYRDNIPAEITTTLDGSLHKAGQLEFVVDGLFTTPEYQVEEVRIVDKVSDHMAVVAEIS